MELKQVIESEYSVIFNNLIIGSVDYCIKNSLMYLNSLILHEEFRGKGLGRGIIEFLLGEYQVDICGNAIHSSIGFWEAIGVDFDECVESCRDGRATPFTLYC